MARPTQQEAAWARHPAVSVSGSAAVSVIRIKSQDLFQQMREVEIDHEGRIYRLRLSN